jgi:PRC-barrel domain protein
VGSTTLGVSIEELKAVAIGWSADKQIVGKTVYNDTNQKIGVIDDLIATPDNSVSYAIIGAGGFRGLRTSTSSGRPSSVTRSWSASWRQTRRRPSRAPPPHPTGPRPPVRTRSLARPRRGCESPDHCDPDDPVLAARSPVAPATRGGRPRGHVGTHCLPTGASPPGSRTTPPPSPDYKRPTVAVPAEWRTPAEGIGSVTDHAWWQLFQPSDVCSHLDTFR